MPRYLLALLFLLPLAAHAQEGALPAPVVENVRARVASGENVGVFVGVVDATGRRHAGFGQRAAGQDGVPDGDAVFEIGSITKAFTGLLLAEMAARGEVSLDDPIGRYLPDTLSVAFADRVTLEHLATHTSGLPRLPDNLVPADPANPYAAYTQADLYRFLEAHTLRHEPGAEYAYSNLGAGLLGDLLARRAGTDYENLLRQRVLEPLGLTDTGIALTPDQQVRLASGHSGGRAVSGWDLPALAGAGALRSTGNDLLRLLAAHIAPDASPLAEAMETARTPRHPAGEGMQVGLGWHVRTTSAGQIAWHNGGTGGYRSFVGFDPARRVGVVVLTNTDRGMDDVGLHLLDPSIPLQAPRQTASVPPDVLDRYVGAYPLAPGFVLAVTREGGQLFVQATGQPMLPVYPASETEFFLEAVDARLTFRVGDDGTVEGVTLHQGGVDQFAPRQTGP